MKFACRLFIQRSLGSKLGNRVSHLLVGSAPVIFVLLWGTGFVVAKFGTADAEPFTFLTARFALTFAILIGFVFFFYRKEFSKRNEIFHSVMAGALLHGVYLGGIFFAVDRGLPAGLSALLVSLQPFSTVLFGYFLLGDRFSILKSLCFCIALAGVFLVLFPNLGTMNESRGVSVSNLLACLVGMLSISIGTIYQKKYVSDLNLLVSTCFQFAGGALLVGLLAILFEDGEIIWTTQSILSMLWLIFVLSIGAVCLLMYLIRNGSSSSVASLFFLVPVVAMIMAWVLFDEVLSPIQLLGSAIVVSSVAFASKVR